LSCSLLIAAACICGCNYEDNDMPCPIGSELVDLDGICEPECVWPSGQLACSDNSHCPNDGSCRDDGTCGFGHCLCTPGGCPPDAICVDEGGTCGMCVPRDYYECEVDSDCVAAIYISRCCAVPLPRNIATVESMPCLVEYPHDGPPPQGCEPDCSCDEYYPDNHCWPIPEEPLVVTCQGVCHMEPMVGPTN
jgi:hypothetical protein